MKRLIHLLLIAAILGACSPEYQTTSQREIDRLTKGASFAMPKVKLPSFPSRTYDVMSYGADNTGVALSTAAIQQAIDECSASGGGTVIIPEGIYTTGPITLKSNVRLYTEKNSFVVFSHDLDLYEIYDEWFEGIPTKRCTSPLNALNAENIAITGYGTFNGNGDWWRPLKKGKMAPSQ
ncbi:MAG: glycoside hydrolase family 28 protein, partial [Paludibacteraceae bacterium]|nr:glycoside hydrolase family 28 protein [Paludibacteraceae bacterium]